MSPRARFWAILSLMLVALAICVVLSVQRIEQDLLLRVQSTLAAAGIPFYGLEVDGRDVVMRGFVASEQQGQRIVEAVTTVDGVRAIEDLTTVERVVEEVRPAAPGTPPGPAVDRPEPRSRPAPGVPARVRVQLLGSRLFVSGRLPVEAGERFLSLAREHFGAARVQATPRLSPEVATPDWLQHPGTLLELLDTTAGNARLVIEGSTAVLSGQVSSVAAAERVRRLAAELPGVTWRFELFTPGGVAGGNG